MNDPSADLDRLRAGVSRRAFLKGSGAAAVVAAGAGVAEAQAAAEPAVIGPEKTKITLSVNGGSHSVEVEPRTTLLEALRYQLNLTGAKPVSDDGVSGASTVFLDGKPVSASTVLAVECRGKKVVTVESLAGPKLDPVPAAFVRHDAQQCGFCTPGFVMAVRAFLNQHPRASESEIRAGLNGNICRCGTYANILPAVIDVVKGASNG